METESGNRETAGRVVVEKQVVKEALIELLNEILAFKVLMSGGLTSNKAGWGKAPLRQMKGPQGRLNAVVKLVSVSIVRHVAGLANN